MAELSTHTDLISRASQDGLVLCAAICGEIDLQSSPELRTGLIDLFERAKPTKLVLNLAQVPYMDSSAIAVLVEMLQKVKKLGGKIYLTELQPRVRGLLEIARLNTIFILAGTDQDAMAM